MCVCVFFVCIFSSKLIRTEEMHLFFFAFSEGKKEEKKGPFPQKKTHAKVLIYSVFTRTKHTHSQRGPLLSPPFERI